jgi:hypothetical protein
MKSALLISCCKAETVCSLAWLLGITGRIGGFGIVHQKIKLIFFLLFEEAVQKVRSTFSKVTNRKFRAYLPGLELTILIIYSSNSFNKKVLKENFRLLDSLLCKIFS